MDRWVCSQKESQQSSGSNCVGRMGPATSSLWPEGVRAVIRLCLYEPRSDLIEIRMALKPRRQEKIAKPRYGDVSLDQD